MPLREILHKLLTMPLSKARYALTSALIITLAAIATSCETDATDIDISGSKSASVMTSIFGPTAPIGVYIASSVAYTSGENVATVGDATVSLYVNGDLRSIAAVEEGQTSVEFGGQDLAEGDSVTITADIASGGELRASAVVMPTVSIEQADTSTSINKQRLSFSIVMSDPDTSTDFYRIDVHRITYAAGQTTDTVVACNYASAAFHGLTSDALQTNTTGIFPDERLRKNTRGQSTLRLSVLWSDLTQPAEAWETDSVVVAVRLHHLSEDYYNFLTTSASASSYVILPVFGSASVASNVEGGYGIVACDVYDERCFKVSEKNRRPSTI